MPWFWEHLPPWEGSYGLSGPALGKAGEPESGEGGPTAGRPAGWLWVRFEPGSPARVPWLLWEWAEAGLLGPISAGWFREEAVRLEELLDRDSTRSSSS